MKAKFLFLVFFLSLSFLNAQSFDKKKMDALFEKIENNEKGMGSVSIFEKGKEVYQKSFGYADIERKVKSDASTKYRIGSISKTFTATIIMKLIEEGKITLSSKLSQFYPQIKNASEITITHLLQHRSGISNFTSVADYMEWNTLKQTKEQLLSRIVAGGITFNPDEKFEYSNSNYVLLTFIAEDVSNESFSALLNRIIINPCQLKNTAIGKSIEPLKNEAFSYVRFSEWKKEKETSMSIPLGAGFIIANASDVNQFFFNLFTGKIISPESLSQMKNLKDNFGLGLFKVPFYNLTGYGHTGGIDGFQSNAYYFPEKEIAVTLLENGVVYPLNDILIGILSIYFGMSYDLPEFTEALVLESEDLDQYIGVYSAPSFPLKLTITKKENILIAQGTGQPSFPLECFAKNKFKFDMAKLELEFIPVENKMILKQAGMVFELTKE